MVLSKSEIIKQIELGNIVADGVQPQQIKDQSIDCSLYKVAWKWSFGGKGFEKIFLDGGYIIRPGDFVLGIIDEWIGTKAGSNLCSEWRLKSTAARHGLDNALAMWIEEGYYSRLCLELYCHKPFELKTGLLIGQFIFHKTEGETEDYSKLGSYQSQNDLEKIKAEWTPEMVLPKELKVKN